jgi:molybdenum cofactor cytidylyltransferase
MGQPKALLPVGTETFLGRLVRVFSSMLDEVVVVLREEATETPLLPTNARVVINPDPERGMLSSLQCGLLAADEASLIAFCPVDVPGFAESTLAKLLRSREGDWEILQPAYRGERGHPVLLRGAIVQALLAEPAASEARLVLRRHTAQRQQVEVEDAMILRDIDTPEDYEKWKKERA